MGMKHLFLLRHAKSDWSLTHLNDFDRQLSERGRNDAPKMAAWLKENNYHPQHVLCSPAKRTVETLELIANTIAINIKEVQYPEELYLANSKKLIELISALPESTDSAMIIAHNPGLDVLLETLVEGPLPINEKDKLMTTAAFAEIHLPNWSSPRGELKKLVRPKEINA